MRALGVAALAVVLSVSAHADEHGAFWGQLQALCGQAFMGQVVSTDPQDDGLRAAPLVMHVRECAPDQIKIPFHVGDNRSRTWVLTRSGGEVTLKHDHRHEDGSEDAITQYGGRSVGADATGVDFPVDDFSIDLFQSTGRAVSTDNTWRMDFATPSHFAYQLSRPGRLVRIEFDLSKTVALPPAPWGHE